MCVPSSGIIHTMCLTFAFEDDPLALIQTNRRLLWFSARVELSVKIRSRMDPRVRMKYPFNKAGRVLVTQGSRGDPSKTCPLFLPRCRSEMWRKYEGAIVLDLSFVNITFWRILFRSDGYTYLDLASSSCDMVAFDRRFVGVWENYTRTPFWLSHVFYLKKRQPYPPSPPILRGKE